MSDLEINKVLDQMKTLSVKASGPSESRFESEKTDFSQLLKQSIDAVNDTQQASAQMSEAFERGESDVSLAEVMVAQQKATISFQSILQVRNKLVDAYKDVMNMPM